jgi:hypothetical protein
MKYDCPVCGYPELTEEPRGERTGGSFEICPSCGFQFGASDDDRGYTYLEWRSQWVANGMKWASKGSSPPKDWNPKGQLTRVTIRTN